MALLTAKRFGHQWVIPSVYRKIHLATARGALRAGVGARRVPHELRSVIRFSRGLLLDSVTISTPSHGGSGEKHLDTFLSVFDPVFFEKLRFYWGQRGAASLSPTVLHGDSDLQPLKSSGDLVGPAWHAGITTLSGKISSICRCHGGRRYFAGRIPRA